MTVHDGFLSRIVDLFDGEAGRVILHDASWSPSESSMTVDQMSGVIAEQAVTLSAEISGGSLLISWDETVSIATSSAPVVGGWVLAEATGSDATSRILRSGAHPGGNPPDPYTVTLTTAAIEVDR